MSSVSNPKNALKDVNLLNILSDWLIAAILIIQTSLIAWISFDVQKRAELKSIAASANVVPSLVWKFALNATQYTSPAFFFLTIAFTPWPLTRFGLLLIVGSGLLWVYRLTLNFLVPHILKVSKFSMDLHDRALDFAEKTTDFHLKANNDFNEWHRIHFAVFEQLLDEPSISDETKNRLVERLREIRSHNQLESRYIDGPNQE